jgi:AcrR family transcriptional regulator
VRGSRTARKRPAAAEPRTRNYHGKSHDVRRSEQRDRILTAARDAFARNGFAATGIDEIVARAHVSRSSFYEFFENKEQCLLAVFALGVRRISDAVVSADGGDLEPPERIHAIAHALARTYADDPAMARVVLIGVVGATPAVEEARVRARQLAAGYIERILNEYPEWRRRSPVERRIASVSAMAATAEPLSDLVATGRAAEWESIVDHVSGFVARALVLPS